MKALDQTSLNTLDQLSHFVPEVMQAFDWYFVKLYWHHREKLKRQLNVATAEAIIRRQIEHERMTPFLCHLDQLITTKQRKKTALYPPTTLNFVALLAFLETRIAALATLSLVLTPETEEKLGISARVAIAKQAQQLAKQLTALHQQSWKLEAIQAFGLQLHPHAHTFIASRYLNGTMSLTHCAGNLELRHLSAGATLQITDSPELQLQLVNCELDELSLLGSINNLHLVNTRIHKLTIQAHINQLHLLSNSNASATITHAVVEDIHIAQSHAQFTLQQSLVHTMHGDAQAILQLTTIDSQLTELQANGYLQAHVTSSRINQLKLEACDCCYLRFAPTSVLGTLEPTPSGSFQRLYKDGQLLAYYASNDLDAPQHTDLYITDSITPPAEVIHMHDLIDLSVVDESLVHQLKPPYQASSYEQAKRLLISHQIKHWGVQLLANRIDPQRTYWQDFCWQYASLHRLREQDPQLSQALLRHAFIKQYRQQLQTGRQPRASFVSSELFSLLTTDKIILDTGYDPLLKAHYRDNYDLIHGFIQAAELLKSYHPARHDDRKSQLRHELLTFCRETFANEQLSNTHKLIALQRRLCDFRVLQRHALNMGHMLTTTINLCLELINQQLQLTTCSQQLVKHLRELLAEQTDDPLIKRLRRQLNNRLKQQSTVEAVTCTLTDIAQPSTLSRHERLYHIQATLKKTSTYQQFNSLTARNNRIRRTLQACKRLLDIYRPIFPLFGLGRQKKACFHYLSQFINGRRYNLADRLQSLARQVDYLMQVVRQTSADTRHRPLMNAMPLWQGRSRRCRGYCAILQQVKNSIDRHYHTTARADELLQSEIARPMLRHCQQHFFTTYKQQQRRQTACLLTP
jgi:hypothetical protein